MPKGIPIGFEIAQKKVKRQTDRQTDFLIFIIVEIETLERLNIH